MSDFTQKYNKSLPISNKVTMLQSIKQYIIRKINEDQEIVRLLRYLTKLPLRDFGITYDGKRIEQPNLNCGLLGRLPDAIDNNGDYIKYPTVQARNPVLIPYPFDDNLMTKEQLNIFIDANRSVFDEYQHIRGLYTFDIIITFTSTYNMLLPLGTERSLEIADRICRIFDNQFNDDTSQKEIGETLFKVRDISLVKVGSKGAMGRVVTIETNPITDRNFLNKARAY